MMNSKPSPEAEKTIPYWPYCPTCKEPMDYDQEEPFAYCRSVTCEWDYPRPDYYVRNPKESDSDYAVRMAKLEVQSNGRLRKAQSGE
jgi:hypothetical protein